MSFQYVLVYWSRDSDSKSLISFQCTRKNAPDSLSIFLKSFGSGLRQAGRAEYVFQYLFDFLNAIEQRQVLPFYAMIEWYRSNKGYHNHYLVRSQFIAISYHAPIRI